MLYIKNIALVFPNPQVFFFFFAQARKDWSCLYSILFPARWRNNIRRKKTLLLWIFTLKHPKSECQEEKVSKKYVLKRMTLFRILI